jgi:hypothetical protein
MRSINGEHSGYYVVALRGCSSSQERTFLRGAWRRELGHCGLSLLASLLFDWLLNSSRDRGGRSRGSFAAGHFGKVVITSAGSRNSTVGASRELARVFFTQPRLVAQGYHWPKLQTPR